MPELYIRYKLQVVRREYIEQSELTMSDIFTTGSRDVDDGGGGIGCGGKRKRTEGMKDSSDEEVDANTLQDRLTLAIQNVEDIRKHMRSIGCYEADSLLRLSDGGDNHILDHIMSYLDMKDIGPCAIVCRTLNNQTAKCWEAFEANLLNHESLRSPSAQSCQQRVVRYHAASTLARQIGAMGDDLSKHAVIDMGVEDCHYTRVEDHCLGCNLPDLNLSFFHGPGVMSDDYELFVRLSRTSDNKLLAEGFIAFIAGRYGDLSLEDLDLSSWSELQEISSIAVLHGDHFGEEEDDFTSLDECMVDLTVVLVAVNKSNSKACLVAAQNDFGGGDLPSDGNLSYGFFNIGGVWHCCPRGHLSSCLHGRVDNRLIRLAMVFEIVQDPVAECQWFLQCWYQDD
jgi:hypothetical protein